MIRKGDKVSVLDEKLEGTVVAVKGKEITVESTTGFVLKFLSHELIIKCNNDVLRKEIGRTDIDVIKKEKESSLKKKKAPTLTNGRNERGVPDFDLHIEKLMPNKKGMSNYDILTLQIKTAKKHLDFAIKNKIPKIIFIHGVGEGVLKAELDSLLGRYDDIIFQDADYRKYGFGATEIYFKQNNKM